MQHFRWLLLFFLSTGSIHCVFSEEQPRKVLFIMGKLVSGGSEQAFISLMNGWAIPNTKVDIYLIERGGILEPFLRKDYSIISQQEAFSRTYDAAACFLGWAVDPRRYVAKTKAKRKVQWTHTDLLGCKADHFFRHIECCSGIDAFVFVSQRATESAMKIQPTLANKIVTVRNILEQDLIKEKAKEMDPQFPKDGLCNVVSVGRLSQDKAFDRAIRVHKRLEAEGIHFRWYVVGGGPEKQRLTNLIQANGLQNKFILLGLKMNPHPYTAHADIFALPSLFEGCSVAVNEAKVLGRPILVTDAGGAREQIDSEKNGLVVDNDEQAIYVGLKRLLLDQKLRRTFSEALKGYEYDNAAIYRKLEQVLFTEE